MDHSSWVRSTEAVALLNCRRRDLGKIAAAEGIRSRKLPTCARRFYKPDILALLRRCTINGPPPEPILARSK
jgi:hypothetical protein